MKRHLPFASVLIVVAAVAAPTAALAQSGLEPAGKDWPYTSGNLAFQG